MLIQLYLKNKQWGYILEKQVIKYGIGVILAFASASVFADALPLCTTWHGSWTVTVPRDSVTAQNAINSEETGLSIEMSGSGLIGYVEGEHFNVHFPEQYKEKIMLDNDTHYWFNPARVFIGKKNATVTFHFSHACS